MMQWISRTQKVSPLQWQNTTPESRRVLIAAYLKTLEAK